MLQYEYQLHTFFFILYVLLGSALMLLHLRTMQVIRRSKTMWKACAYRFIFYGCAADAVNCAVQVAFVAATLQTPVMHPTANMLLGALFQTTYDVELPMIFILAVNRFVAVVFPKKLEMVFNRRTTTIMLIACFLFGAVNGGLCVSGEVQSLWDPLVPTFFFTNETTFVAVLFRSVDLYLSEVVVSTSFALYIAIVIYLLYKRKSNNSTSHFELSLIFHSFQTLLFAGVLLYFWYYPLSDTAHYFHIFNVLVILRFGSAPISLLITNRTIRNGFLKGRWSKNTKMTVVTQYSWGNRARTKLFLQHA